MTIGLHDADKENRRNYHKCADNERVYKVPFLKNRTRETALLCCVFWRFSEKHHFVNSPDNDKPSADHL